MKKSAPKICVAGDGWGALAAVESIFNSFSHVAVVTSDNDVKDFADENQISIRPNIEDVEADLYGCAGYKPIIDRDIVSKNNIVTVHYSLLPKYRYAPTVWAI